MSESRTTTPARRLEAPVHDGVRLLGDRDVGYADGAEAEVLRILRETDDLSSTSDELRARARSWPERYHFDPARANFLRAFDLPEQARVLEVGCGCGAVTRWLGETAAVVDAVEPMLPRALAAAARTRDLDTVQVFCGGLDDLPEEAAYDVVVVVGVLEYVGHGSPDPEPYLAFLRGLERRLAPGGSVVLAIENALGVKYLAGAAEDHSGRPWESLEGYATDAPARTFDDRALAGLFASVGLQATVHGVFPDYKLPRTFVTRTALERSDTLAASLPRMPSPDWHHPRVRTSSEGALWASLVAAGTAATHPNSLVAVATRTRDDAPHRLVPDDLTAVIVNTERRREYMSQAVFRGAPGRGTVTRERLDPAGSDPAGGPRYQASTEPLTEGRDLLAVVSQRPEDHVRLLRRWVELLDGVAEEDLEIDQVPHNVLLTADDELCFVDSEWAWPGEVTRAWVLSRGVVWGSASLARTTYPSTWPQARTVGDLAARLATAVGLGDGWQEEFLRRESRYQAAVGPRSGRDDDASVGHEREELQKMLEQPLTGMPLGARVTDELQELRELRAHAVHEHMLVGRERDEVRDELARARGELSTVHDELGTARDELGRSREELDAGRAQVARLEEELRRQRDRRTVRAVDFAADRVGGLRRRLRRDGVTGG